MPKKRKTRKDKILTEQKRQVVQTITSMESSQKETTPLTQQSATQQGLTFSLPTNYKQSNTKKETVSPIKTVAISTADYGYLGKDLIKTTLISSAVILAELLIKIWFRG